MTDLKPVIFLGDSLDRIRGFPREARHKAGFQLDRVQRGLDPDDWKPLPSVGPGVREIRVRDRSGGFRVIYLATFPQAVFVLNAFQKKTQKTPWFEIRLAAERLRQLQWRKR